MHGPVRRLAKEEERFAEKVGHDHTSQEECCRAVQRASLCEELKGIELELSVRYSVRDSVQLMHFGGTW